MKKRMLILLCVLLMFSAGCIGKQQTVGTIDGEGIPMGEFRFFLNSVKNELLSQTGTENADATFWETTDIDGKNAAELAKEKAFEQIVLFKIKLTEVEKAGYSLTDAEKADVTTQYQTLRQNMGEAAFDEQLAAMQVSAEDYQTILTGNALLQKYLAAVSKDTASDLYVSDDALTAYYEQHHEEYLQDVKADVIGFPDKESAQDTSLSMKDGMTFDELLTLYTEIGGAAVTKGAVYSKGELPKAVEETAMTQAVGEISLPVLAEDGTYYIVRTTEKNYRALQTFSEELRMQIAGEAFDKLATKRQTDYNVQKNDSALSAVTLY